MQLENLIAERVPFMHRRLDNGLSMVVAPDPAATVVSINVWYKVGSRDEPLGRFGIAHFIEHLMFQGTERTERGEFTELINRAGGSPNATTGFDRTSFFMSVPRASLELALWLEADRMHSRLRGTPPESLRDQLAVIRQEAAQRARKPEARLFDRLVGRLAPSQANYGHNAIGDVDALETLTIDDVHAFADRHHVPQNAVVTLVGAVRADEGFALIERYFAAVQNPPKSTIDGLRDGVVHAAELVPTSKTPVIAGLAIKLPSSPSSRYAQAAAALDAIGRQKTGPFGRHLDLSPTGDHDVSVSDIPLHRSYSVGFVFIRSTDSRSIQGFADRARDAFSSACAAGLAEQEWASAVRRRTADHLARLSDLRHRAEVLSELVAVNGDTTASLTEGFLPNSRTTPGRLTELFAFDSLTVDVAA
ncbi:M16 family metallopeptidase [Leifsonia sp. NPDC056824]|uniref:M16 family metallopeptidase n=1 Tax=Leifsonia sp. NPDC056824 TaxID=3345953 RepID=UPI0036D1F51E